MNERIKELEDMANRFANAIVFPDNFNDAAVSWHRRVEFNTKFAELIVKECATIAAGYDNGSRDESDRCARAITNEIKSTFGVEK
jgi:hypothetical protein